VNVLGTSQEVPWFPRKISDLDRYADRVLEVGIYSSREGAAGAVFEVTLKLCFVECELEPL
jgi:hypothetical protein